MVVILSFLNISVIRTACTLCRRVARNFSERTPFSPQLPDADSVPPAGKAPAGSFWKQYIMILCKINSFLLKKYFFLVRYHHIAVSC